MFTITLISILVAVCAGIAAASTSLSEKQSGAIWRRLFAVSEKRMADLETELATALNDAKCAKREACAAHGNLAQTRRELGIIVDKIMPEYYAPHGLSLFEMFRDRSYVNPVLTEETLSSKRMVIQLRPRDEFIFSYSFPFNAKKMSKDWPMTVREAARSMARGMTERWADQLERHIQARAVGLK